MAKTVRVPDPIYEQAKQLKEKHDFGSIGEAIRIMCLGGPPSVLDAQIERSREGFDQDMINTETTGTGHNGG